MPPLPRANPSQAVATPVPNLHGDDATIEVEDLAPVGRVAERRRPLAPLADGVETLSAPIDSRFVSSFHRSDIT